jgi:hypothetical protein
VGFPVIFFLPYIAVYSCDHDWFNYIWVIASLIASQRRDEKVVAGCLTIP